MFVLSLSRGSHDAFAWPRPPRRRPPPPKYNPSGRPPPLRPTRWPMPRSQKRPQNGCRGAGWRRRPTGCQPVGAPAAAAPCLLPLAVRGAAAARCFSSALRCILRGAAAARCFSSAVRCILRGAAACPLLLSCAAHGARANSSNAFRCVCRGANQVSQPSESRWSSNSLGWHRGKHTVVQQVSLVGRPQLPNAQASGSLSRRAVRSSPYRRAQQRP